MSPNCTWTTIDDIENNKLDKTENKNVSGDKSRPYVYTVSALLTLFFALQCTSAISGAVKLTVFLLLFKTENDFLVETSETF